MTLRGAVKRGTAAVLPRFLAFLALLACAGCGAARPERVEWPTMGTLAALQSRGASADVLSGARRTAQERCDLVMRLLNAHDPSSELSRLAALPDDTAVCSRCDARVLPCYAAAFALRDLSGGAFDPRWKGAGTLDLGAIAKGFAVDLIAAGLRDAEADLLVDIGGNLKAVRGTWRTGVRAPSGDGLCATVSLAPGEALATSAEYFRGRHIFDARTGIPAASGVASVSVLCRSAMWADGLSTVLFILGPEKGGEFLDARLADRADVGAVAVLWIMDDGRKVRRDPANRFGE